VVQESHDDFPGVEISIAGGVGEMVRVKITLIKHLLYRKIIIIMVSQYIISIRPCLACHNIKIYYISENTIFLYPESTNSIIKNFKS